MRTSEQGTKYQLFEGREKQTLLDKYINFWTDRDSGIDRADTLIEEITVNSSKKVAPSVAEEYKKFLLDRNERSTQVYKIHDEDGVSALSDLIKSRKNTKTIL